MKNFFEPLKTIFKFSIVIFILCGFMYPLTMTGMAQIIFPSQANGSIIYRDSEKIGSELIGQEFTDLRFMKCRPSAVNYNTYTLLEKDNGEYSGIATGSNNYAPSNPKLKERVEKDMILFLNQNPTVKIDKIPADLLTASGSGLDPHISLQSAYIQVDRIIKNTGLSENDIIKIIEHNTDSKFIGVFGEETVNVLGVNIEIANALDNISENH